MPYCSSNQNGKRKNARGEKVAESEMELIWKELKTKVDALITYRILLFHNAMVERGQIEPMPKSPNPVETCAEEISDQDQLLHAGL
jgi:hypothetical protein